MFNTLRKVPAWYYSQYDHAQVLSAQEEGIHRRTLVFDLVSQLAGPGLTAQQRVELLKMTISINQDLRAIGVPTQWR